MRLETPSWWYGGNSFVSTLLTPAGAIYGAIAGFRMERTPRYRPELPVICIGNLTAGGGGKTPAAITIARMLTAMGEQPVILSRGYGGREKGPVDVSSGDRAADVGDEPLLLAEAAPTIVAADRGAGARRAVGTGASVILMDDGFQSPALAKDLSLICIDAAAGIGNGRIFPAGPLRAPLVQQLDRANAIILIGEGDRAAPVLKAAAERKLPLLTAKLKPVEDIRWLTILPVIGFAGIARPEKFFTFLKKHARIAETVAFPDHHAYSQKEAEDLLQRAVVKRAMLVTTEKDWVRLPRDDGPLGELRHKSRPISMRLAFDEPGAMQKLLDATLALHRAAAAPLAPRRKEVAQ